MDPPTRQAPPETAEDVGEQQKPWVQCTIQECSDATGECQRMESWVLRQEHMTDYKSFLDIRNFEPAGFLPGRLDSGKGMTASISCNERSVDTSLSCTECIRLIKGGPYGIRGVAVGAYPMEREVLPCLELSKPLPKYEPMSGDRYDGNSEDPRQTAFCNVISARL
eukprot:CAMPEP_0183419324 /NCGR_PEP_ID=MMETSP0370-20130417/25703_1 /TAXON_ID=268820 /ORGANISM="Peridinium aciculiferum, Strain PAER-2" /LENGTH=165 /DNA_ID=CAMNT_0025603111 /DNA_START=37 /DNA_END=534 /DNA_ORIENTATION=-